MRSIHPLPPYLTLIGSSNYGRRSAALDLEANVLVTTTSFPLRKALERELDLIRADAKGEQQVVSAALFEREERLVPLGVRYAAKTIENML